MSESATTPALAPWGRWDRVGIWIVLSGTAVYAAAVLTAGIVRIVTGFASGTYYLSLPVDDEPVPDAASAGSATLIDGHYETAFAAVTDLSAGTSALLGAGVVLSVVTEVGVALSFLYLAWRLLRAKPFIPSLSIAFSVAGATLALGSLISQFLTGFGSWQVVTELGSGTASSGGFWPLEMRLDPAPIGFGFGLLIVASAFYYGERLTRETEGLV
jgi:hypothetical protein